MNLATVILLFTLCLAGLWLVVRGWRGRVIDDNPFCARCGFNLFARSPESGVCPECGSGLTVPGSIRVGKPLKILWSIHVGLVLSVLTGIPLVCAIVFSIANIDPIQLKPLSWLLTDAASTDNPYRYLYAQKEVNRRMQLGRLSAEDELAVVKVALRVQGDPKATWDPQWGDLIERLHGQNRLSAVDWNTYLSQDEPAEATVIGPVSRGSPIEFKITGQRRGSSPTSGARNWNYQLDTRVNGYSDEMGENGGSFTDDFVLHGVYTPPAVAWRELQPGPHSIDFTAYGIADYQASNPTLYPPIHLKAKWVLKPFDDSTDRLYHDEEMARQVEKTLSCQVSSENGSSIVVVINASRPPIDLCFDIQLGSNGIARRLADYHYCTSIVSKNTSNGLLVYRFEHVPELVGKKGDVVVMPCLMLRQMRRVLDHDFIFHDMKFGG